MLASQIANDYNLIFELIFLDPAIGVEYPVGSLSLVKKMVTDNTGQPILMPVLQGTYYYNGMPSYANMDPSSLKEAIRKQM